jgi:hypothetical protein
VNKHSDVNNARSKKTTPNRNVDTESSPLVVDPTQNLLNENENQPRVRGRVPLTSGLRDIGSNEEPLNITRVRATVQGTP